MESIEFLLAQDIVVMLSTRDSLKTDTARNAIEQVIRKIDAEMTEIVNNKKEG